MRLEAFGGCLVLFCVACSPARDEDVAATEPGEQLDGSDSGAASTARGCACPQETPNPDQGCDVETIQSRFAGCENPIQEPCATIELGCNDVPTNVGALDCVLDQLTSGNAIRYSVNRATCPGEDAYAIVVSSSGGVAFGLECYRSLSGLVPFDAAFMEAAYFGDCLSQPDAIARYACLEAGLGFAEGNAARCE